MAMGFFRGASHSAHLAITISFLAFVGVGGVIIRRTNGRTSQKLLWEKRPLLPVEWGYAAAISLAAVVLVVLSIFVPLTQNDALEYAMVARELYATRDLLTYPVLNPETNVTGIYAPWTHPPFYVALMYIAEIVQGHAEAPGLIRLLSPWFLLSGAYVTYALGAQLSRATGLAASLIFMSPPLFFLGAGQSLLDPLPVLGLTLIVAAVCGISTKSLFFGAIVGMFLGISLWTHSQAILFVPLAMAAVAVERGLRDFRAIVVAAAALLVVALIVGGWPYWRNVEVFGTPISDNPAVFALPNLHWEEYFSINRGLGSIVAQVQYGVLKGWFSPEAYGLIFWGLAVGLIIFLRDRRRMSAAQYVMQGARGGERAEALLWLLVTLLSAYLAGVLLSLLLGIDHMIKNERYLLVTLPVVSILCAHGYEKLRTSSLSQLLPMRLLFTAALPVLLSLQFSVLLAYQAAKHEITVGNLLSPLEGKLFRAPEYALLRQPLAGLTDQSVVLSMKPSDMYYGRGRVISYLDPRLLPFYAETDASGAYQRLVALGVTHIHLPDYGLPPFYNSQLHSIVRDPALTRLVAQTVAGQIYGLGPEQLNPGSPVVISPDARPWTISESITLMGRKGFARSSRGTQALQGSTYSGGLPYDLFRRHWLTTAVTGVGSDGLPHEANGLPVEPSQQYALDLKISGTGFVKLVVLQFATNGDIRPASRPDSLQATTFELSPRQPEREYGYRFLTGPSTDQIAVAVETVGQSSIRVDSLSYTPLKEVH
ncbi:ArnT family glycosyltransferase [Pseudorhizobium halotolerans]|nr:hypothetical protein [Pseudorhizobium halotolerans]